MTVLDPPAPLSPAVQRARLANLLRNARRHPHTSVGALARKSGRFASSDLKAFERGDRDLDGPTAIALAELYGVDLDLIAPPRTLVEIDLDEGRVGAAGVVRPIGTDDTLGAYLELVYELRGQRGEIPLRDDDVQVLATTLDLDADDVEDRLVELMKVSRSDARKLLSSLAIGLPAGAAVAGLIVVGSLAMRDQQTKTVFGSVTNATPTTLVVETPVTTASPTTAPAVPETPAPIDSAPPATTAAPGRTNPAPTSQPTVEVPDTGPAQVEAPVTTAPGLSQPPVYIGDPPVQVDPDPGSGPGRVGGSTPDPEIVAPNQVGG